LDPSTNWTRYAWLKSQGILLEFIFITCLKNSAMKKVAFYYVMLLPLVLSCGEEDVDPAKAILGKWEVIEAGSPGQLHPYTASGYVEYREDGTSWFFDYDENQFTSMQPYVLEDGILRETLGINPETSKVIYWEWKYQFFEKNNKLRLDCVALCLMPTWIFQRVK
jgi:hypothetical protein